LNIALFVFEYPPNLISGIGTYGQYITKSLVDLGHKVIVFTYNNGKLPERENINGIEVIRVKNLKATPVLTHIVKEELNYWLELFNEFFCYNFLSVNYLANLIQKEGYPIDIVAICDWATTMAGLIAQKELSLPVVFHIRSTRWGEASGSTTMSNIEIDASKRLNHLITISNEMKLSLIEKGYPESKISVVPNGVAPEIFDPASITTQECKEIRQYYGIKDDEVMLFYIGRLTPFKNVRQMVEAMSLISKEAEFQKVKLVIVGRGSEELNLKELIKQEKLSDKVICRFEYIPEREKIKHFAASDICVFPSSCEPFGIAILEAMSMGKPIIVGAKEVVGFHEQVIPCGQEQCGIHINGEDPIDIAWGIKEALINFSRLPIWGESGRKRVLNNFTWKKIAQKTIDVYKQLILQ